MKNITYLCSVKQKAAMKKRKWLALIAILMPFNCVAQESIPGYYYYHDKLEEIPINSKVALVYFRTALMDSTTIHQRYTCHEKVILSESKADTLYACEVELQEGSYDEGIVWLRSQPEVYDVEPIIGSELHIPVSNAFYIKLFDYADSIMLKSESARLGVQYEGPIFNGSLWYQLSVNKQSTANALSISTQMGISGLYDKCDPGFIFKPELYDNCVSDVFFSSQWGMDAINICDAWNISTGSSNIKVAVIDQGIDASHPEFCYTNITSTFDMINNSSPSVVRGEHGTHVAGIIFANHNEGNMAGIAPNVSLIDISDSLELPMELFLLKMALAFSKAKQQGADVINCSWGMINSNPEMSLNSSLLEDAIYSVLENGRSGKGSIVIFAAGNYDNNSYSVRYPANTIEKLIVVGAIKNDNTRASFSCYGSQLDIMAPGYQIYSTIPNSGYGTKNGTSMAAPHVAGVAALMLSVNPNLSRQEVDRIIKGTAQKIGGYTYSYSSQHPIGSWNNEMGYGLLDAAAAVEQAYGSTASDLYIKDVMDDNGTEPNITSSSVNISPDIKVFLSGSTTEATSLEYGKTYTVKVTIRNPQNVAASLQYSKVKVHWTVISNCCWRNSWTNAGTCCSFPKSGVLSATGSGSINIPANGSVIVNLTLSVPRYETLVCTPQPKPSTMNLVAVIEDGNFIAGEQAPDFPVDLFVKANNNIAWHSYSIIESDPLPPGPFIEGIDNAITSVAPNPSAGSVVIEYLLPENVSIANLLIMNNYGQTIANRTIYSNNEQESVHNLKEGTYMVLLVSDGLLIGKKVLVVY